MRVERAIRPHQARLRRGQLTAAVDDLTDSTHTRDFGCQGLDQIHMQLCGGIAPPSRNQALYRASEGGIEQAGKPAAMATDGIPPDMRP